MGEENPTTTSLFGLAIRAAIGETTPILFASAAPLLPRRRPRLTQQQ